MSHELIMMALEEDIGEGDVTSDYFIPEERMAEAFLKVRNDGVVSGVELAKAVFLEVDPNLDVQIMVEDGSRVGEGAMLMRVSGKARSILTAERTALNFLQRLSGVATMTSRYVALVKHTQAKILDTRKTTPGYRALEKKAVADGGGTNHRMGLFDRAMVKDNHLAAEGGIAVLQEAIRKVKSDKPHVQVELEADRLEQVRDFLALDGVDYILLDNMSLDQLREAVEMRGEKNRVRLEASGGVNLETVKEISETGVDFISVGALTHSAPSLDIGLDFTAGE
ncbi:MAG: carboxylating nicotinate-nucleotide diphosphorylase [Akkermansiaceae bacterium]|jgi:nicotinate-nucleotide pyrophosphorylase (carboxylating)|nr:carboxylating nicotinate-nucleotide diphosphorylase [Akkermansiaceae bacterium]MDP4647278.1 carboxylating nicotinate-nucleotide diphosphorylase [Akkermansiaceae bacterium]MDP4722496.1 carboxylating nicotinate-nucleotide diphosphorylase [Akkermansiaceae bacterium]MDP4781058.1 carboxylating nicotinate-nucleotide diphosphorylase [Akkermansiaceae bacterium]MDP4848508.1 carboxylating nicotinate-nucleotide diphosphorylase [Akkermansiaceae bacterium]